MKSLRVAASREGPERLRKDGGKLCIPLGQRIAHMRPEGCRRIRDLRGELGSPRIAPSVNGQPRKLLRAVVVRLLGRKPWWGAWTYPLVELALRLLSDARGACESCKVLRLHDERNPGL